MSRNQMNPIEPSGKAIQDYPSRAHLAQDFACSRGWVHPSGRAAILTEAGGRIADNFEDLALRMRSAGAFFETSSGAEQITQEFHSLSDEEVLKRIG